MYDLEMNYLVHCSKSDNGTWWTRKVRAHPVVHHTHQSFSYSSCSIVRLRAKNLSPSLPLSLSLFWQTEGIFCSTLSRYAKLLSQFLSALAHPFFSFWLIFHVTNRRPLEVIFMSCWILIFFFFYVHAYG